MRCWPGLEANAFISTTAKHTEITKTQRNKYTPNQTHIRTCFFFTCAISRKLKPRHRTIYSNTYNKCTLLKQKRENIRIKQYKFRCCTLVCPRLRRINKIHQLISIRLHLDGATIP